MTHLTRGDADLHYEDGTHRCTAPTTDGHQLALYERRIKAHLEAHNAAEQAAADKVGDLADAYWHARWAHDDEKAKAIWDQMGEVATEIRHDFAGVVIPEDVRKVCIIETGTLRCTDDGGILYRGHWLPNDDWIGMDRHMPEGFRLSEAWSEPYRAVWLREQDDGGQIVTYCEGDITVQVLPNSNSYTQALRSAGDYYREGR